MAPSSCPFPQLYDLIGVGFGPANLALSGALLECTPPHENVCFIEKHDRFRWHPGMLLSGVRMQISWLKDLATLRNPQSPITFLNYLHCEGRLVSFINNGSPIPSRKEFADYLTWAANYVQSKGVSVFFGEQVIAIPKGPDGTVYVVSRNLKTGEHLTRRTKNLVISPGGSPRIPNEVNVISPHQKVIHSSVYSASIQSILFAISSSRGGSIGSPCYPVKVAVIGSGQSAAEVVIDLRSRLQDVIPSAPSADGSPTMHEIDLIINKGSLKPSDDSPFSNEIFNPTSTDTFFGLKSKAARDHVLREFRTTNYGVVNPRTIDSLYELLYEQQMDDSILKRAETRCDEDGVPRQYALSPRLTIRNYSSLVALDLIQASADASENGNGDLFLLTFQNGLTKQLSQLEYDAVICATGYDRSSWYQLLRRSELGKNFIHGDPSSNGTVHILPDHTQRNYSHSLSPSNLSIEAPGTVESSTSASSGANTPPTSPGLSSPVPFGHTGYNHVGRDPSSEVYVTRAYQLVPKDLDVEPLPRVYIQGCTESTHGLADTLLSVISVRAGEIAADLTGKVYP